MDRPDLEAFVRNEYPRVVAAVGFASGDRVGAEDAVQDVLASLLGSDVEVRDPRAFVVTAAMNRVRSRERRRGAERRAMDRFRARPPLPGAAPDAPDVPDDEVLEALRELPHRQREAVALHYLLDMAVTEVATTLGVSVGTVKTQLHRARAALRERLGPDCRLSLVQSDDQEVEDVPR